MRIAEFTDGISHAPRRHSSGRWSLLLFIPVEEDGAGETSMDVGFKMYFLCAKTQHWLRLMMSSMRFGLGAVLPSTGTTQASKKADQRPLGMPFKFRERRNSCRDAGATARAPRHGIAGGAGFGASPSRQRRSSRGPSNAAVWMPVQVAHENRTHGHAEAVPRGFGGQPHSHQPPLRPQWDDCRRYHQRGRSDGRDPMPARKSGHVPINLFMIAGDGKGFRPAALVIS